MTDKFNFCSIWAEVIFIPDKLSGRCVVTSVQLGPK